MQITKTITPTMMAIATEDEEEEEEEEEGDSGERRRSTIKKAKAYLPYHVLIMAP